MVEFVDLEFGAHGFLINHVFLPTEQAETNICWIIYQDATFKICLSLFSWKENILDKMHIVQWSMTTGHCPPCVIVMSIECSLVLGPDITASTPLRLSDHLHPDLQSWSETDSAPSDHHHNYLNKSFFSWTFFFVSASDLSLSRVLCSWLTWTIWEISAYQHRLQVVKDSRIHFNKFVKAGLSLFSSL